IDKDENCNDGGSCDQSHGQRRGGMIDRDQRQQDQQPAEPRIESHHGITSIFSPRWRMRRVIGPLRVANATVMPPPMPSFTAVTSIGNPREIGIATGVQALVSVTNCVRPEALTAMTSPSGSMLSMNTSQAI